MPSRKRKPKAPPIGKRVVDDVGLVHAFVTTRQGYQAFSATSVCGVEFKVLSYQDTMQKNGWRIVSPRPVTCLRCALGGLSNAQIHATRRRLC